ncbi:MAG: ABC transporter ATP-binding protein [Sphaerochaetaceae bacterium]|jgi:NitT/TauT family transport system ATP-binding protein|nr:ABC transporter ATP-binding protein [Sphaerochaetaceae bacterium]
MKLNSLSKHYIADNKELSVLKEFSLEVEKGTIVALLGPSGCGKTTLLRLIAGLEKADGGEVTLEKEEEGPVSFLFQEPRLLPWHNVLTNVELVLRPFIKDRKERIKEASKFLEMVNLLQYSRFKVDQLSGGMRQRVAIARAFAFPANLMLLDEPFQSLDQEMRLSLIKAYLTLWEQYRRTTLFVTHNITEALLMADTIVRLSRKPMGVLDTTKIDIPQRERSLQDPHLLYLMGELHP